MIKRITFLLILSGFMVSLSAQSSNYLKQFEQEILLKNNDKGFEKSDFNELHIQTEYTDIKTGITHIYFQQQYKAVPIYNALGSVHIKAGKIVASTNSLIAQVSKKLNSEKITITAYEAIQKTAQYNGIDSYEIAKSSLRNEDNKYVFDKVSFAKAPVMVDNSYFLTEDNQLRMVWEVLTQMKESSDIWNTKVDAASGKVLDQKNHTIYCNFTKSDVVSLDNRFLPAKDKTLLREGNGTYKIYPLPAESPLEGSHELIEDPFVISASPLGWHDTNGTEGADYTITRGNNVWAFLDKNDDDVTDGGEPDGGADLVFDFAHELDGAVGSSDDAAQVNLFYMNNMMHDLTHLLGFTEEAGNFQHNVYDNGGQGGDAVSAQASDGSGEDNANFSTGPDGTYGRMQMFLWNNSGGLLTIDSPQDIAGLVKETGTADFGTPVNALEAPITGKVVVAVDGSSNPFLNCNTTINGTELNGNIAIVQRAGCNFVNKTKNAQDAGAIAVIICNIPGTESGGTGDGNSVIGMTAPDGSPIVTIPTLMMKKITCDQIIAKISNGEDVVLTFEEKELVGPEKFDAAFDNGVIGHEYGHGISNRLVAGPSNTSCLSNEEQMGEGWSDFWTVVFTTKVGDTGDMPASIGNYVDGQGQNGNGIRSFPYSTDMSINPLTYDIIKNTPRDQQGRIIPHPIGTIWNTMLNDLYWAFIDLYGFDPDWSNTESGNFKAAHLIIEGMKLTTCRPGFVNARDAIITADGILNDDVHNCMIWEVFARRGLGYYAKQGDTNVVTDGTENFDPLPTCIQTLKIKKEMSGIINQQEEINVSLDLNQHILDNNDASTQTGVVVKETIPAGLEYVDGSASVEASIVDGVLVFQVGELSYDNNMNITYKLRHDGSSSSTSLVYDPVEEGENDLWELIFFDNFDSTFDLDNTSPHGGENSWYVADDVFDNDQAVKFGPITVSGTNPTLKFWHKYLTEASVDGGFLEVSTDGGTVWNKINGDFLRNGYNSSIAYGTFAIPSLKGFTGNSNGYVDSYVDLSNYKGQDIYIRFRFGTNEENASIAINSGWYIDDVEIIDIVKFKTTACITSIENPEPICTDEFITILNADFHIGTDNLEGISTFKVFPNPAHKNTVVSFDAKVSSNSTLSIYNINGQVISENAVKIIPGNNQIDLSLENLISGQYLVVLKNDLGQVSRKISIVD